MEAFNMLGSVGFQYCLFLSLAAQMLRHFRWAI
jgi:hypothetical protein